MDSRIEKMVDECKRQEVSCLYTSTSLFEWLKEVRHWRTAFIVLPIIAGSIAGAKILTKEAGFECNLPDLSLSIFLRLNVEIA
jgi:hypothetical protein